MSGEEGNWAGNGMRCAAFLKRTCPFLHRRQDRGVRHTAESDLQFPEHAVACGLWGCTQLQLRCLPALQHTWYLCVESQSVYCRVQDGKYLKKRNTFTDMVACAEHLIAEKYTSKDKLCIEARPNLRPSLESMTPLLVWPALEALYGWFGADTQDLPWSL